MKRIILLVAVIILCIIISGCGLSKTETTRQVIDFRYTEPYTSVVTVYKYKYSISAGKLVLVPDVHSVIHPERYEILYLISYDDGTTKQQWQEVERAKYQALKGGVE